MCNLLELLKEIASLDRMTNDVQYNRGLQKLREGGITILDWTDDIRYYAYCNGIGCWK